MKINKILKKKNKRKLTAVEITDRLTMRGREPTILALLEKFSFFFFKSFL